jgi:dephospho-CoA kinase
VLRVGLTGGLGSGKSTVAKMLAAKGAQVLESDAIGRALMMSSNTGLRDAIVARFGPEVFRPDGRLDNAVLARIAFTEGRVEELNAIVHPAVIARQIELIGQIASRDPSAIVVVESALIFESKYGGPASLRSRFDRIVLVTAPEDVRIERYVERISGVLDAQRARRDAHRRIAYQLPDEQKAAMSDFVLQNDGSLAGLQIQVDGLWEQLLAAANE